MEHSMRLRHFLAMLLALLILSGVKLAPPTKWENPRLFPGTLLEATYTPSILKSIQTSTIAIADTAASGTAAITSVDTTRAVVQFQGWSGDAAVSQNMGNDFPEIELTSAILVTASRSTAVKSGAMTVAFTVLEYLPVVLKSNVQRGTIAMTSGGANSVNATISAVVVAKSLVIYSGTSMDTSGSRETPYLRLTGTTTVNATRNGSTSNSTTAYQVVEFK
jgi:hypothetical protein